MPQETVNNWFPQAVEKGLEALKRGKAVAFLGPYQCGKSTTACFLAARFEPDWQKRFFLGLVAGENEDRMGQFLGDVHSDWQRLWPTVVVIDEVAKTTLEPLEGILSLRGRRISPRFIFAVNGAEERRGWEDLIREARRQNFPFCLQVLPNTEVFVLPPARWESQGLERVSLAHGNTPFLWPASVRPQMRGL